MIQGWHIEYAKGLKITWNWASLQGWYSRLGQDQRGQDHQPGREEWDSGNVQLSLSSQSKSSSSTLSSSSVSSPPTTPYSSSLSPPLHQSILSWGTLQQHAPLSCGFQSEVGSNPTPTPGSNPAGDIDGDNDGNDDDDDADDDNVDDDDDADDDNVDLDDDDDD